MVHRYDNVLASVLAAQVFKQVTEYRPAKGWAAFVEGGVFLVPVWGIDGFSRGRHCRVQLCPFPCGLGEIFLGWGQWSSSRGLPVPALGYGPCLLIWLASTSFSSSSPALATHTRQSQARLRQSCFLDCLVGRCDHPKCFRARCAARSMIIQVPLAIQSGLGCGCWASRLGMWERMVA